MEILGMYNEVKLPLRINLNIRVIKSSTKILFPKVNIHLNEFIISDILNEPLDNRKFGYHLNFLLYEANEFLIYWKAIVVLAFSTFSMSKKNYLHSMI